MSSPGASSDLPGSQTSRRLRILSLSHAVRDDAAGAAGASLRLNQALRVRGHHVVERYADEFGWTLPERHLQREQLPAAAAGQALVLSRRYDVIEITGHAAWLAFPLVRAYRSLGRGRKPLLVSRSYGLEHFDHEERMAEHRASRAKVSFAYRLGGGFLTLRQVEVSVAAADLWAVPRPGAATWAEAKGLKRPEQSVVAGWGADEEFFAVTPAPEPGRIAWVGTTVERKGWQYFREAVVETLGKDVNRTLALFGTGLTREGLAQFFPSAIRDRVIAFPKLAQADLIAELAKSEVYVSASLSEGYHLATLQALALGIPVIATREGFLSDLPNSSTLVRSIDKRSSAAIRDALLDRASWKSLGNAGREFARRYRWDAVAERTERAYREAIARL